MAANIAVCFPFKISIFLCTQDSFTIKSLWVSLPERPLHFYFSSHPPIIRVDRQVTPPPCADGSWEWCKSSCFCLNNIQITCPVLITHNYLHYSEPMLTLIKHPLLFKHHLRTFLSVVEKILMKMEVNVFQIKLIVHSKFTPLLKAVFHFICLSAFFQCHSASKYLLFEKYST